MGGAFGLACFRGVSVCARSDPPSTSDGPRNDNAACAGRGSADGRGRSGHLGGVEPRWPAHRLGVVRQDGADMERRRLGRAPRAPIRGHDEGVNGVAWSPDAPDGKRLAYEAGGPRLRYTARDGGDPLRTVARGNVKLSAPTSVVTLPVLPTELPAALVRLFSGKQYLSDAFYQFLNPDPPTNGQGWRSTSRTGGSPTTTPRRRWR